MVSIFFADTVRGKAQQTYSMTYIFLASPCGYRETMQTSSAYNIPHISRQTYSIAGAGPIDVGGSFRCTSLARVMTTVSTATKEILNSSGDSIFAVVLALIRTNPSRRRHQVAHNLSSHHGLVE